MILWLYFKKSCNLFLLVVYMELFTGEMIYLGVNSKWIRDLEIRATEQWLHATIHTVKL